MEFEPDYFGGILKIVILTLLVSILPIYLIENKLVVFSLSVIGFIAVLISLNKKWIKKIRLDIKNAELKIEYPMNFIGQKVLTIPFSEISEVVYYDYMYRTPAHFKIIYNEKKIRLNCSGNESEKVNSIFEENGIKINFHHKKEVGYR